MDTPRRSYPIGSSLSVPIISDAAAFRFSNKPSAVCLVSRYPDLLENQLHQLAHLVRGVVCAWQNKLQQSFYMTFARMMNAEVADLVTEVFLPGYLYPERKEQTRSRLGIKFCSYVFKPITLAEVSFQIANREFIADFPTSSVHCAVDCMAATILSPSLPMDR
jgi:hypothetical protein